MALILFFMTATGFLSGCGQLGDRFGSISGVPPSAVATWGKVDLDPVRELTQPYILYGDEGRYLTEPCYLHVHGLEYLYYEMVNLTPDEGAELAGAVYLATAETWVSWQVQNGQQPVLAADQAWERVSVGAPDVLLLDGRFVMWYAGGGGAGIGMASSADGIVWEKYEGNPVLTPDQAWEGGEAGVVAAPSVIFHEGRFKMYYSGGVAEGPELARRVGNAIGYAESSDGMNWVKRDAAGHMGSGVQPVFKSTQMWEGKYPEGKSSGSVSSPYVMVEHPVDRDVFRMYYTGNLQGDPVFFDASIGYAGSFDGLNWEPVSEGVNPVLGEKFPVTFPGISNYILYGEFSPSVIKRGDQYRMIYGQTDSMYNIQGLAIAVCPVNMF